MKLNMKVVAKKYCHCLIIFGYFLILLGLAIFVRDIPDQPDAFRASIQEVLKPGKMFDPTYFATAALEIYRTGWVGVGNQWILNLWPPGFILMEASILSIAGPETPIILIIQFLSSTLFSAVLFMSFRFLKSYLSDLAAFLLPLVVFLFPVSRLFLLQPTGVILGESFSIGFFLIALLLGLRAIHSRFLIYAFGSGVFLALSAYFRSQFEIILLGMTACGVGIYLVSLVAKRFHQKLNHNHAQNLKSIFIILVVAHVAMFPWRIYHWVNQGSPAWVFTSSVTFENSVKTSEQLQAISAGFVVDGGGNLVCRLDPSTCGNFANAKIAFVKTFLNHPLEWYSIKAQVFSTYWFASLQDWSGAVVDSTSSENAFGWVCLLAICLCFVLFFTKRVRNDRDWILIGWFNSSLFMAYVLIFTVQQFEVRYFYFPKIFGIIMAVYLAGIAIGKKSEKREFEITKRS